METKTLAIDLIRTDADTQARVSLSRETVEEYAELFTDPGEWPFEQPLVVYHDGTDYYLADGFHRIMAASRVKRASVPCVVNRGTAADARIYGMKANDRHGLRMTQADKRKCVEWLLDNCKMSQREMAATAGVTRRTVATIISERNAPPTQVVKFSQPERGASTQQGEDDWTDSQGTKPEEIAARPPRSGKDKPGGSDSDLGQCPACAGNRWYTDDDGTKCSRCGHPHGEPAGDVDDDRIRDQRSRAVKTAEALLRAVDDLQLLSPNRAVHELLIGKCKEILAGVRAWK